MRFAIFFLIALSMHLNKVTAENSAMNEIRFNLPMEKLSIREDGVFLITQNIGDMLLENLQHDDRGYYTICQIGYLCTYCQKQVQSCQDTCDQCGRQDIEYITFEDDEHYYTIQNLLCAILNSLSVEDSHTLLCGTATLEASANSDGDRSISFKIEDSSQDGNLTWEGGVEVNQNKEGNTNAEVSVKGKLRF